MMSLGSVPTVPLPALGLARVLSERAGARCCVCLWCRLRSFSSKTVRKMMMSKKMTQPAPTAANNATLELKKLSGSLLPPPLAPGPLFSFWFTVSGEVGKGINSQHATDLRLFPVLIFMKRYSQRHLYTHAMLTI